MAITGTNLANGNNGSNTVTTGSLSISSSSLVFVFIGVSGGGAISPTVTGAGLTWNQFGSTINDGGGHYAALFYAFAPAGASGALTIKPGVFGNPFCYNVDELTGVNGTIVQSNTLAAEDPSVLSMSLPNPVTSGDATYGVVMADMSGGGLSLVAGSGYAELSNQSSMNGTTWTQESEFDASGSRTVNWTYPGFTAFAGLAFGLEVAPFIPIPLPPPYDSAQDLIVANNKTIAVGYH